MTFLLMFVVIAFFAGLACGYTLRPHVDRRRRIRAAIAQLRASQLAPPGSQPRPADSAQELPMPRDYYAAGARERGSLAEGFGLKGQPAGKQNSAEPDLATAPMPRDYYERETPDDEGILSEGYGLRRRTPPTDPA
ncbi:MAG: hypothetical protein ACLGHG_04370 [Gammaproteobacteria bacterium]